MTALEEYRVLEAEVKAKRAKVEELERLLIVLDNELKVLQEELARQRQAIPYQGTIQPTFEPIFVSPEPGAPGMPIMIPRQPPTGLPKSLPIAPEITLGEVLAPSEWWRENWLWMGVGLTGLVLIMILAKT